MVSTSKTYDRLAVWLLAAIIVVILVLQTRLLYIFPQPDSARWWGDETGQMLELRAELQHGYAYIPTGLGSSVAITNGIVRGNSWLAAIVYGVPALIFYESADLVSIGRTVTFLLSIVLIAGMYRMLRSFGAAPGIALLSILFLVSTRSFFFASHAARLDVVAGITVLAFTWYLSCRYELLKKEIWRPSNLWYFGYGTVALLSATLSIHLLTLIGLLSFYMLWRFRAFKNPVALLSAIAGVLATTAILLCIYFLSGSQISLFGPSVASNQFQSVAGGLPMLRPFSRSVQIANILERLHGLWAEAPAILLLTAITTVISLVIKKHVPSSDRHRFLLGATLTVVVAWLLLESPALYYYVQILPLVIIALIASLSLRINDRLTWATTIVGLLLGVMAIQDCVHASAVSSVLNKDNSAAIQLFADSIRPSSSRTVLAQNPAIAMLEFEHEIRLMTPHIVDFSISKKPLREQLDSIGVDFMLLYAAGDGKEYSGDHYALRPIVDSFGEVIARRTGRMFDVRRDYFSRSSLDRIDTVTLYRLRFAR
jgi:hypothetical protein